MLQKRSTFAGNRTRLCLLVSLILGLTLLSALDTMAGDHANKPNTLTEAEQENGWQLLFDGTTLLGWKSWNTKQPVESGKWQAKNGALTLTEPGGGDIYTARSYENFVFKIEFKTTGNSGIFFRVNPDYDGSIWHYAPEIQVLDDGPGDTGKHSAGALYDLYAFPTDQKRMHTGGWNSVKIRIDDNQYTHWFNGQKVTDVRIGGDEWNKRVKNSKFDIKKFGQKETGHFGVQDHGHKVQYRNIKVKPLD